jgi:hypothetical protein
MGSHYMDYLNTLSELAASGEEMLHGYSALNLIHHLFFFEWSSGTGSTTMTAGNRVGPVVVPLTTTAEDRCRCPWAFLCTVS